MKGALAPEDAKLVLQAGDPEPPGVHRDGATDSRKVILFWGVGRNWWSIGGIGMTRAPILGVHTCFLVGET